jgi:hypothetical protein
VELIPKAVVSGLFVQSQIVTTGPASLILQAPGATVTRDIINRIWTDVVKDYPYQALQLNPVGSGGAFVGSGPEDAVLIQSPLVQIRDLVQVQGVLGSAEKIEAIFKTVIHHIGGSSSPANLGIKLVYHAPAPGGDAVSFILSEMMAGHDDVQQLAGGMALQGMARYLLKGDGLTYTLSLEPLQSDQSSIFIELDVQYSGLVDSAHIKDKVLIADEFVTKRVRSFLERRAEDWST